jgi:HSP20 family molecular chaperone IbpA
MLREIDATLRPLKKFMSGSSSSRHHPYENDAIDVKITNEWPPKASSSWKVTPRIEHQMYDDEDVLYIDVPGVTKNDVKVQLHEDRILVVKAMHRTCIKNLHDAGKEAPEGMCLFRQYERAVRLPPSVDTNRITSYYKDGIIILHFPHLLHSHKDLPVTAFPDTWSTQIKDKLGFSP